MTKKAILMLVFCAGMAVGQAKPRHALPNKPFDTIIPTLIAFYERQIELHQKLIDIGGKFIAGPREGIDYQALVAKMPEIRAELDDVQKSLFQATPIVFMALIDPKPNSQDHLSSHHHQS